LLQKLHSAVQSFIPRPPTAVVLRVHISSRGHNRKHQLLTTPRFVFLSREGGVSVTAERVGAITSTPLVNSPDWLRPTCPLPLRHYYPFLYINDREIATPCGEGPCISSSSPCSSRSSETKAVLGSTRARSSFRSRVAFARNPLPTVERPGIPLRGPFNCVARPCRRDSILYLATASCHINSI
jgi:hypothetical protein